MINQKRVLMVISRFPPVVGGAERQCLNLSRFLVKNGNKVTVATEKLAGLESKEIVDGVTVLRLPAYPKSIRFLANFNFWANLKWLFINKSSEFDIVHCHVATASAFFGAVLAKVFGKVSIVKFTGSGITGEVTTSKVSFYGRIKLKLLDKLTDLVVCTDLKIKEELISVGYKKDKIQVIPNGVDTEFFKTENEKNNQIPKILFVGRLENVKNVPVLLRAWKTVSSQTKAELNIVGGGSKRDYLTALAKELNITDSVRFIGEIADITLVPSPQSSPTRGEEDTPKLTVKDYLDTSDIFVLPSFAEGVSNSLLEAMSCGMAVIASRVGGSVDMITDCNNGYLFESNNVKELADKLLKLIKDKALRITMGQKARETMINKYSIDAIGNDYIKLYNELLAVK